MPERSSETAAAADGILGALFPDDALWPWVARFMWSPAADLHPTRREMLLPGWPESAWSDENVRAHVSRYLLLTQTLIEPVRLNTGTGEFRLALLPQAPLARLARYIGLALHGAGAAGQAADEADRAFVRHRAPLYWRGSPVVGDDAVATGWRALRLLVGSQPAAVTIRFEWKTPSDNSESTGLPGAATLLTLARRVSRELEEPWASLFASLQRPDRQIRLRA